MSIDKKENKEMNTENDILKTISSAINSTDAALNRKAQNDEKARRILGKEESVNFDLLPEDVKQEIQDNVHSLQEERLKAMQEELEIMREALLDAEEARSSRLLKSIKTFGQSVWTLIEKQEERKATAKEVVYQVKAVNRFVERFYEDNFYFLNKMCDLILEARDFAKELEDENAENTEVYLNSMKSSSERLTQIWNEDTE